MVTIQSMKCSELKMSKEIHMDKDTLESISHTWPTWSDGKPVKICEKAISLRGPLKVTGIELTDGGWNLWGYSEGKKYIIDQGNENQHPTREGEDCDFWSPSDD